MLVFPLKYLLNLSFKGLSLRAYVDTLPWAACPYCAFPWSVVLGKLLPAFLCFFRNDDRKGKVYKWSNIIWKKVSAKSNPQWEDCPKFFFLFFFLPPFQKIVKTQATHTCKRIKKERKLQLAVIFSTVIWLLLSFQLLKWRIYNHGCFTSPGSVLCFTPSLKMNLWLH